MAMEQAERQKLDDLKAEEKQRAEEEVYRTFSEMECIRLREVGKKTSGATAVIAAQSKDTVDHRHAEGGKRNEDEEDDDSSSDDANDVGDQNQSLNEVAQEAFEEEEIEAHYIPGPRNVGGGRGEAKVKIGFTPRVFPTPMRESKRAEEEDWIARNRQHLHKNKVS